LSSNTSLPLIFSPAHILSEASFVQQFQPLRDLNTYFPGSFSETLNPPHRSQLY
jgi:hypothetical protein